MVSCIEWSVFSGCSSLTDVYYNGTAKQWAKISIGSFNESLTNATIHYAVVEDPMWADLMLLLQIGQFTPPVGLSLFVMKGVSPPEVTMNDIIKGAIPFLIIDILAVLIIVLIPPIVTVIPGLAG